MVRPTAHRIHRLHSGEGEWIKVDTGPDTAEFIVSGSTTWEVLQTVLKAGNNKIIQRKCEARTVFNFLSWQIYSYFSIIYKLSLRLAFENSAVNLIVMSLNKKIYP